MRIGIDLGGTKIEGIALGDDGRELARRRVPTPRDDYEGTLSAIAALAAELERAARPSTSLRASHKSEVTVGVGIPGAISPKTGLVKNANSTWLNGRPLDRDLQARLGRPVRVANDANCFALSEAVDGAAAGARVVFGVIIGTGTGGGVVVDGAVTGRSEPDSRGVGAQSDALARWRGAPRTRVLLRPHRLHRDLPLRSRIGARP